MAQLLDRALDLSPQELESWLAELERSEPDTALALRDALDEKARLDAEGFLEGNLINQAPVVPSLVGQRVGAYTLESLLGEGGMGTVWLAHRSDGRFEGRVAIKLLNVALIGRPSEQRFTREGSVLARLQHANIAHLADAGMSANGQPYLVLEYVQGDRIDVYCERRQLDVTARIKLFLDVLAAVSHAHGHLVVHRDIKPANILVTEAGVVKLLDFGVAALLVPEAGRSELTREFGSALTPEYAAPEQLAGGTITTSTDVYALGLVLFVLLVGRHPVAGEGKTPAEVLYATLEKDPPIGSTVVSDVRLKRTLKGDLDNILCKALKRDPAERYPSAAAFGDDLKRYLAWQPVQARPDSFTYRAKKFVRRHALEVGATTVVVLLIVGTAAFALWQMFEARAQRDSARFEARRAEAASEFLSLVFEEVGPTGTPLSLEQLLDRGVGLLERQNGGDPAIMSRMLVQASRRYLDVGNLERHLVVLDRAIELAKQAGAWEVLASAECAGVRAEVDRGKLAVAKERVRLGQEALARVGNPAVESQVDCMRAAAETMEAESRDAEALKLLQRAREMLEESGSTRGLQYTAVLTDAGGIYYRTGDYAGALAMMENVAAAFERNGRGGTVGMTTVLANQATILYQMGEALGSEARSRENMARETAAASGRASSGTGNNYGSTLLRLERYDEALSVLEQAAEAAGREGNGRIAISALTHLARLHTTRGNFDDAERLLRDLEARFVANPENHQNLRPGVAAVRVELSMARGDLAAARQQADAVLASTGFPEKQNKPLLKTLLPVLARLSLQEGDPVRAQAHAREALTLAESMARPGNRSAEVGEALLLLSKAQHAAGNAGDARRNLPRAIENLERALGPEHSLTRDARALLTTLP
jgi:eukaryotic-like serine/threonine-protein kinase